MRSWPSFIWSSDRHLSFPVSSVKISYKTHTEEPPRLITNTLLFHRRKPETLSSRPHSVMYKIMLHILHSCDSFKLNPFLRYVSFCRSHRTSNRTAPSSGERAGCTPLSDSTSVTATPTIQTCWPETAHMQGNCCRAPVTVSVPIWCMCWYWACPPPDGSILLCDDFCNSTCRRLLLTPDHCCVVQVKCIKLSSVRAKHFYYIVL